MLAVGICGTFDVENFGDLLFPIVAEAELSRRLGPVDVQRFSYFSKQPPDWPYAVASVADLQKKIGELSGILIGGGHLIRFDKMIAPNYLPPSDDIHHPTGYWLMPALLALQQGRPVVWNALGAYGDIPAWAEPLMRVAIEDSSYVAVRDEVSRLTLLPFANGRDISIVPDTCFGISRIVDRQRPSRTYSALRHEIGLTRPYVVVQADARLRGFCRFVENHRKRFAGYQFVSVPIGPILGDNDSALAEFYDLVRLPRWPNPMLMSELIGGACAVAGVSLHLAITALSFGLPAFRPQSEFEGKFIVLSQSDTVYAYPDDGNFDPNWFEQKLIESGSESDLQATFQALDVHWNKVAACLTTPPLNPPSRDVFAAFAQRLPCLLETEAGVSQVISARDVAISARDAAISARDAVISARDAVISARDAAILARDQQIAATSNERDEQKRAVIARDQQIAELTSRLMEHQDSAVACAREVAELNATSQFQLEQLQALRESTSWKVTAPLRWVGQVVGRGRSHSRIVRFGKLSGHTLNKIPYHWAFVNDLFAAQDAKALVTTYPRDHFKTVRGYDGEKGYEYEARPLVHMGANAVSFSEELSPAWKRLANDLLSPAYRAAMTRLVGHDLTTVPMEAYVCHFGPGAWLGPHVDLKDKIVTHVFYFNENWDPKDGGCLNILRSSDMSDSIAEITPIVGNTSVLVRSNNSWHSVSRVVNGCRTSRRSMNVIFYHPGAISTMWPPGDTAPLHRYDSTDR
jgi:Rps23 Pro-64 3,4-dihydroxylase Tpa1-like proline 4-hydroxylase